MNLKERIMPKLVVLHNGVEALVQASNANEIIALKSTYKEKIKSKLGLPIKTKYIFLYAGRFKHDKGADLIPLLQNISTANMVMRPAL